MGNVLKWTRVVAGHYTAERYTIRRAGRIWELQFDSEHIAAEDSPTLSMAKEAAEQHAARRLDAAPTREAGNVEYVAPEHVDATDARLGREARARRAAQSAIVHYETVEVRSFAPVLACRAPFDPLATSRDWTDVACTACLGWREHYERALCLDEPIDTRYGSVSAAWFAALREDAMRRGEPRERVINVSLAWDLACGEDATHPAVEPAIVHYETVEVRSFAPVLACRAPFDLVATSRDWSDVTCMVCLGWRKHYERALRLAERVENVSIAWRMALREDVERRAIAWRMALREDAARRGEPQNRVLNVPLAWDLACGEDAFRAAPVDNRDSDPGAVWFEAHIHDSRLRGEPLGTREFVIPCCERDAYTFDAVIDRAVARALTEPAAPAAPMASQCRCPGHCGHAPAVPAVPQVGDVVTVGTEPGRWTVGRIGPRYVVVRQGSQFMSFPMDAVTVVDRPARRPGA